MDLKKPLLYKRYYEKHNSAFKTLKNKKRKTPILMLKFIILQVCENDLKNFLMISGVEKDDFLWKVADYPKKRF